MKLNYLLFTSGILFSLSITSCYKIGIYPKPGNVENPRKVEYRLYTGKDFSDDNAIIEFQLSIKNSLNQILWDSLLAPMKIKDIPDSLHMLTIEKWVPGNTPGLLKVGFYYKIENVGISWYLQSFHSNETFKLVDFNFQ